MTTYNGWTNYETWCVNLWYDGVFTNVAEQFRDDVSGFAQYIEEYVMETIEGVKPEGNVLADLVNAALSRVSWHEIADHYLSDLPEAEEDAPEDE